MYPCLKPWQQDRPDGRYFTRPCGRCHHCATNRINQIVGKLTAQALICFDVIGLTLTVDDNRGPLAQELAAKWTPEPTKALMKALRQDASRRGGCDMTHWFGYEKGGENGRGHLHGFIFVHSPKPAPGVVSDGDLMRAARENPPPRWMFKHTREFIRDKEALHASLTDPQVLNLRVGQQPQYNYRFKGQKKNGYLQEWKYWKLGKVTAESLFRPQGQPNVTDLFSRFRYAAKYAAKGVNDDVHANEPRTNENPNHGRHPADWIDYSKPITAEKRRIKEFKKKYHPPPVHSNRQLFGVDFARERAKLLVKHGLAVNDLLYSFGQRKQASPKQQKLARDRSDILTEERGSLRKYEFAGKLRQRFIEFYAIEWARTNWPDEHKAECAKRTLPEPSPTLKGRQRSDWQSWAEHDREADSAFAVWFERHRTGRQAWPHSDLILHHLEFWWERDQDEKDAAAWLASLEAAADRQNIGDSVQVAENTEIHLHPCGRAVYRRVREGQTLFWREIQTEAECKAAILGRLPRSGAYATEIEVFGGYDDRKPRTMDNAAICAAVSEIVKVGMGG